jgi:curved DNA-binding protein CbpA
MKNLYEVLGVSPDATDEDIKKAYRKRAQETHPDTETGSSDEFTELNEAYTILLDRKSRLTYDRTGSTEKQSADNDRIKSIQELQRVMLQILEDFTTDDIFFMDLPAHVLNIFNANIERAKNNIVDLKKKVKRLRRYKKRFHYKNTDNNDFITIAVNGKIYGLTNEISSELDKIRAFNLMLELLASYDYEPEIKPQTFGIFQPVQ